VETHPSAVCRGSAAVARPDSVLLPSGVSVWKLTAPYMARHTARMPTRPAAARQPITSALAESRSGPSCAATSGGYSERDGEGGGGRHSAGDGGPAVRPPVGDTVRETAREAAEDTVRETVAQLCGHQWGIQ
jgi:hypothetical protein